MKNYFPSSVLVKKITTTTLGDDAAHVLTDQDIPFYAADMQCQTKAVTIGVGGAMYFKLNPTETYWTYNANLRDFMVKNTTATEDGELIILATVPNQYVEKALDTGFRPRRVI